jgi:hypothetical protein
MTPSATTHLSVQRERVRSRRGGEGRTTAAGPQALRAYLSALLADTDPRLRLQSAVDALPALVQGCDHASIATITGGRLRVEVASDRTGRRADELQEEHDEGPCLQAVRTGHSVIAHDLRTETRWLGWRTAAVDELGVTAVLSVLLAPARRPLATLTLYSDRVHGLSSVDLALLHAVTRPLGGAILDVRVGADRLGPAA